MRSEAEVKALKLQIRVWGLRNPNDAFRDTAIALTILDWVVEAATLGEVAHAVTDGAFGAPPEEEDEEWEQPEHPLSEPSPLTLRNGE